MKKILTLILLFISSSELSAQTKIDEFITIKFPSEPTKFDTIASGMSTKVFYFATDTERYFAQKSKFISDKDNDLPKNINSLIKRYKAFNSGFIKSIKSFGFEFKDFDIISIDNFKAYKIRLLNKDNQKISCEMVTIFLNNYMYSMAYMSVTDFNEESKSNFLKSLQIDSKNKPKQLSE